MNAIKHLTSLSLALALAMGSLAPSFTYAEELDNSVDSETDVVVDAVADIEAIADDEEALEEEMEEVLSIIETIDDAEEISPVQEDALTRWEVLRKKIRRYKNLREKYQEAKDRVRKVNRYIRRHKRNVQTKLRMATRYAAREFRQCRQAEDRASCVEEKREEFREKVAPRVRKSVEKLREARNEIKKRRIERDYGLDAMPERTNSGDDVNRPSSVMGIDRFQDLKRRSEEQADALRRRNQENKDKFEDGLRRIQDRVRNAEDPGLSNPTGGTTGEAELEAEATVQ